LAAMTAATWFVPATSLEMRIGASLSVASSNSNADDRDFTLAGRAVACANLPVPSVPWRPPPQAQTSTVCAGMSLLAGEGFAVASAVKKVDDPPAAMDVTRGA